MSLGKTRLEKKNSYPSIYLRGGEGSNGNNKVTSQRFLRFSLPPLIQNIILYYCGRTRRHILRSGDSLGFPENTMDRRSPCEVTDLPPGQVQAKRLPFTFRFPRSTAGPHRRRGSTGWVAPPFPPPPRLSHRVSDPRLMRSASRHFRRFGKEASSKDG